MARDKRKIILLKLLFFVYLLIPLALLMSTGKLDLYLFGQFLGLLSLAFIAVMPLLSSRMKIIERGVGQDLLVKWHSWNGKMALFTVILHPAFLFGRYIQAKMTPLEISEYYHPLGFWLGYVLLILLIIITVTSIFTTRLKLDYEVWKKIHLLTYVVIIGGFVHSFLVGSHIQTILVFQIWWLGLLAIAIVGIAHRNLLLPSRRLLYKVEKVVREADDIISIYLKPLNRSINYFPGQFAYTRFYSASLPKEEHHFTISSSPADPYLRFTIKALGDFTSAVSRLKKNEKIYIEGPYGSFSNEGMNGPFLFIAGGIGITPIMSMLRNMSTKASPDKTVLLYTTSNFKEMAFKDELEKLATKNKWFDAKLLNRRIAKEDLEAALTSLKETPKVFLVGPEGMMKATEKLLIELKVPKANIYSERFTLK